MLREFFRIVEIRNNSKSLGHGLQFPKERRDDRTGEVIASYEKLKGDNDPLDIVELSDNPIAMG